MPSNVGIRQLNSMSDIPEHGESDLSSREDSDDDEAEKGLHHRNLEATHKRRYTRNWDSLIEFGDAANNLDQGSHDTNDLSKQIPGDNFMLKEMSAPPIPDKVSPNGTDDSLSANTEIENEASDEIVEQKPPPIPKKRTNIIRSISANFSDYDEIIETGGNDVRVEVDADEGEETEVRTSYEVKYNYHNLI